MAVWYVRTTATGTGAGTSWDNACTFATALSSASASDVIVMAAGTYTSAAATNAFTISVNNLTIYGGFNPALTGTAYDPATRDLITHQTKIDGQLGRRCLYLQGRAGVVIDGLWLINGYAVSSWGGGLRGLDCSTITVRNCHFRGNRATSFANHLSIHNDATLSADWLVEACTFAQPHTSGSNADIQCRGTLGGVARFKSISAHSTRIRPMALQDAFTVYLDSVILVGATYGLTVDAPCVLVTNSLSIIRDALPSQPVNTINVDPLFTNTSTGDLSLTLGSPAIDAAAVAYATTLDAYLRVRKDAGHNSSTIYDLGALEFQPTYSDLAVNVASDTAIGLALGATLYSDLAVNLESDTAIGLALGATLYSDLAVNLESDTAIHAVLYVATQLTQAAPFCIESVMSTHLSGSAASSALGCDTIESTQFERRVVRYPRC